MGYIGFGKNKSASTFPDKLRYRMKLYEMDYNKRRIVNAYPVRSPYIVQRTSTHA